MASEEIGEINPSNPQGCGSSRSSIQVGHELGHDLMMNEDDIPDVRSALIFRVPQPLRESNDHLYSPNLVSIGPFHYGKEKLKGMEKSKSEAVRRMQKRIQRNVPHASIKSIVEEGILLKEKEIRNFYGEHIPLFTPLELAWMVTRDACFVFEFLVNYVGNFNEARQFYEEEVTAFSWMYDPVFDATYQNPTKQKLMDDILLFENQIPYWVLQHLLQIQMGSIDAANGKLDALIRLLLSSAVRHTTFMWTSFYPFSKCGHVLDAVYLGMVGSIASDYYLHSEALQLKASSRNRIQICFKNGVESLKVIYGLWCNLCLRFLSSNTNPHGEADWLTLLKLPTAVELTRAGVKICPVTPEMVGRRGYSGIMWIRFDEKTSTLYLPQVRVTPQSDSVMRSIIAMEVSFGARYHPKPVIQFALFMDELIDSEEDVAVLRKADVIHNFLGSNQQVADHFNTLIKGIAPASGCKVFDDVRWGLRKYTKRKYKILWSEFVSAYFSKPWLVAGSMAAVLLLLMTVAQVFCLFFTCNA